MSEILSNITIDSINQNFTVNENQVAVTPEAIQLNIFTGAGPVASGSNTNVQFNDNGPLGGSNAFTFNKTTNVVTTTNLTSANLTVSNLANLGSVSNVKIQGGTNQFFLQTDGTGNLTWAVYPGNISGNSAPGGANTQIQFNDTGANFGGAAGFTFNKTSNLVNMPGDLVVAGNISGNIANANYAAYAGNVVNASQPNITSLGTLSALNVTGTVVANTFSGNANLLTNIPGANVVGTVANANFASYSNLATYANIVTDNAQPNITSVGILTDLRISNNEVHIGANAGANGQSAYAVAIGWNAAANTNQGVSAIAIGSLAGYTNQGLEGIAFGSSAGGTNQGAGGIAIGRGSGASGQGVNSIAIGTNAAPINQQASTIVLNATGANLDANTANAFYVKPVRNTNSSNILYYNSTSGEISYDIPIFGTSIVNGTSNVNIPSANSNVTISVNNTPNVVVISNTGITTSNITANNVTISNIGNISNTKLKQFNETVLAVANTGTSISPDISTGTIFRYTCNNNFTFNGFTNAVAGASITVILQQDGVGGRNMTSTMKFAGGINTLSGAINAIDIMYVFYDGTTYYASLNKGYV